MSQVTGLPMRAVRTRHACSYRRPAMYATAQTIIGLRRIVEIGHVGHVIRRRSASDIGIASIPSRAPLAGFHHHQETARPLYRSTERGQRRPFT